MKHPENVMRWTREDVLTYHLGGKVGLRITKRLQRWADLCLAYTPGVAEVVREIHRSHEALYRYTAKANLVAVVTDGTAILGLGDLGARASIPVMEGKAILFKAFGDVDGWPVPLEHCRQNGRDEGPTDPARVIEATCAVAPMYGGINLEDIAAPACFEIEETLDRLLDVPVFHDDQWGTAVITLAAVWNYAEISGRRIPDLKIVINGAGAAGLRIAETLKAAGAQDVTVCDSKGVLTTDRPDLHAWKRQHAVSSTGRTLREALRGAHVFIGVSVANCLPPEALGDMADFPALFAMANPDPEIRPEVAREVLRGKPYVMATGRSDYPNQINNVLGFPFLFRGALDVRARTINIEMKMAAARALAQVARQPVSEEIRSLYVNEPLEFGPYYLIPKPFDSRLFVEVSYAVADAAVRSGVGSRELFDRYYDRLKERNRVRAEGMKSLDP